MGVPISNVTRRVVYAASGTGPYNFTFEILAATDVAVYRDDTLLTLTTDYTVTINANGTGFITLVASPTGATQIAIVGNRTIQRMTDFVTGGDFFANTVNDEMDQQTIFAQQNAEGLQRALQAPQTDPTNINMILPRAADRAGKTLNFDSNGNPIAGLAVVANATANVATWLGTPTSANLRAAMTDETGSGALVFGTSPTLSGPVISDGTANGVAYLNGSKVLTTGSALTFDGSRIALGTATSNIQLTTTVNTNQAYISLADADGRTAVFRGPNSGAPNCAQIGTTTNHDTAFLYGNAEQMRLTSGNLGIGTSSPAYRLQITNTAASNFLSVVSVNTGTAGILLGDTDSATVGRVEYENLNNAMTFFTNGSERARIDSSGNFLLGTTSAISGTQMLQVVNSGDDSTQIRVRCSGAASGRHWRYGADSGNTIYVINQDSTGVYMSNGNTAWTGLSDERYKDIIEPITGAAEKVASLRAVIGKFKTDEDGKRRAFLIAQDVQAVLPEAVDASNPERLGVTQTDVIPLLVAAIKEQQAIINQLKARLDAANL